jgi:2-methylisocitrate lyase-like PEP mutase family enzyme
MLANMQTRDDLYEVLKYRAYEEKLDQLMEREDGQ